MTRLNFKLQKLKSKNISISFKEIKENFPNNCITKFGIHVIDKLPNTMIVMRIGNKRIPFNIDNIRELNQWFYPFENQDNLCSDEEFKRVVCQRPYITLIPLVNCHKRKVHTGAFFNFYNNMKLDLTRYQIFKNDSEADYTDNCLLYALKMGGLCDDKYKIAKGFIKTAHITKKKLIELCDTLDITISLEIKEKGRNRKNVIGSSKNKSGLKLGAYPYYMYNERVIFLKLDY